MEKQKILIVDDSEMNRALLADILGEQYDVREAENGIEALEILSENDTDFWFILLDIMMPEMDGFGVLNQINKRYWNDRVVVMMISSDDSPQNINRAYSLGAYDYISRPFDPMIVRKRIANTMFLYARQRDLEKAMQEEFYEHQRNNDLMVSILSHIVEFRNGESGLHVQNVKIITELLLRRLVQITDRYTLSAKDIALISMASAMHDIGKISIPEAILNKPGKLTAEEFEIIKTHSEIGARSLLALPVEQFHSPLVKFAYEICRWHHERYDGKGYPDGLKGEAIPISAQVVAMADVYDALTSERCYKKAYSHAEALAMILDGKCGTFNPILLQCLAEISVGLEQVHAKAEAVDSQAEADRTPCRQGQDAPLDQPGYMQLLYVDPLTKVYNRRYYKEYIQGVSDIEAIAVVDVDNFDQINEAHGHEAGNHLLRSTAQNLLSLTRRNDCLIHYNDDKFLIGFNRISGHIFGMRLEEIRMGLETLAIDGYPQLHPVVSISGVHGTGKAGKLFHMVDDILNRPKATNNQVTVCFLDDTEDGKDRI